MRLLEDQERLLSNGDGVELQDAGRFRDDLDKVDDEPALPKTAALWSDEVTSSEKGFFRVSAGRSGRRLALFLLLFALFLLFWTGWTNLWPGNTGDEAFRWKLNDFSSAGRLEYPEGYSVSNHSSHCHSHNDYTRKVPLFEALYYGCVGVEADVWLQEDGELFVGHTEDSLTPDRTFLSLYVNPIAEMLDLHRDAFGRRHIFPTEANQSLIFLVDFKTDGHETFESVNVQLEYLRAQGDLTYWNGEQVIAGPVTVVLSGNAPFDAVNKNQTYRDMFFDAPLSWIHGDAASEGKTANVSSSGSGQGMSGINDDTIGSDFRRNNSYYASADFYEIFGWRPYVFGMDKKEKELMRAQVAVAHAQGLVVRYWGAPSWPWFMRNSLWRTMMRAGADMINADDLKAVTSKGWLPRNATR